MTNVSEDSLPSMYHEEDLYAGVSGRRRKQLMMLHRAFDGPFDAAQAASALDIDLDHTRRLLAALAASEWLARVRKGWYIGVPLEASEPREWREDPWAVAAALFSPGYIGGWSAVEHWGLTDQIFNVIYVIAGRKVKPARQTIQGTHYLIRTVPERTLFGTRRVWRQRVPVNVSDPHRTIIDILDVPKAAGGALHASEVLQTYFESEHADQTKLLQYGDRLGRGTVFKRLGYLAERAKLADVDFIEACHSRITKGLSQLDPSGPPNGRIIARWNLRVNTLRLAPDEGDGS
jgi:predicted transcriptional regulator of viral defense system